MLTKDEIETAVKNGMVFNRKPTEPVLTKRIYDLMRYAYKCGFTYGLRVHSNEDEEESETNFYDMGLIDMLSNYFEDEWV